MRCRSPSSMGGILAARADGTCDRTEAGFSDAESAIPIHLVQPGDALPSDVAEQWACANNFQGTHGQVLLVPNTSGQIECVVAGWDKPGEQYGLAGILNALPAGDYDLVAQLPPEERADAALASLLVQDPRVNASSARLLPLDDIDPSRVTCIAHAELMARAMIDAPASDMGPSELAQSVMQVASRYGARVTEIVGSNLLESGYPLIHAVGRAAAQEPRLLDLRWGDDGPKLTLIGKGVCFDTGGLNLKSERAMALMKKDMAGAAVALALAQAVMALGLPVQLRLMIPALENSVSGNAFRPGDILTARSGCKVEITNTDAEGRLVLADALTAAGEDSPQLTVCFATLTGAARVALGPDIVPFYTDNDRIAALLSEASQQVRDPVWRLPLWRPYETLLTSHRADLVNSAEGAFGGSLTAALFLSRFAHSPDSLLHFDIYGWQPTGAPARPSGGVGQAWRAVLDALPKLLHL